jgi:hypothetical protein
MYKIGFSPNKNPTHTSLPLGSRNLPEFRPIILIHFLVLFCPTQEHKHFRPFCSRSYFRKYICFYDQCYNCIDDTSCKFSKFISHKLIVNYGDSKLTKPGVILDCCIWNMSQACGRNHNMNNHFRWGCKYRFTVRHLRHFCIYPSIREYEGPRHSWSG